jgi:molybdate transport system substrate-binding protein
MKPIRFALALGLTMLQTHIGCAAEIKILSSPPARAIVEALAPEFEKSTGHTLNAVYHTAFEIKKDIDAGAAFDLAILPKEVMDEVMAGGHVAARKALARIPIGIGIKAGLPKPDIGTVEGFRQALLKADSFAYTQGAMSGRHVLELIDRLGIADAMKPKLRMASGGTVAVALVSRGEAQMNVDLLPEMIRWPNVEIVGLLPAELRKDIRFETGIGSKSQQAAGASALVALLTSPAGIAVIKAKGMLPVE